MYNDKPNYSSSRRGASSIRSSSQPSGGGGYFRKPGGTMRTTSGSYKTRPTGENNNSYKTPSQSNSNSYASRPSTNRSESAGNSYSTSPRPSGGSSYQNRGSNAGFQRSSTGSYGRPSNGYSRSSSYGGNGGYNSRPRYAPRRGPKTQLGGDVSMFIKKAQISEIEEIIPHKSFSEFNIADALKENITAKGFTHPTPVQDQAIEPILEGRDLIGLANTGTGKTGAFLIPIIDRIFKDRNHKALIIAPTRELAVQINDELKSLAAGMRVYSALVIGGANMYRQIHEIRRSPHVVIGTPGRLKDLVKQNVLHLEDFSIIVLDEVDLMVDIGFIEDVKYFISMLPKERQSLFFSATISPKIRTILETFVKDAVTVSIKKQVSSENIEQDIIRVINPAKKVDQLHELLIKEGFDKVLVFGRTKHGVEKLQQELTTRGFRVGAIHGNKSQGHRQRVLQSFKRNELQILLATDVASRGIDIDNVSHVINYELPETYEDYIHRIGRTGRAGKTGSAFTFIG